MDIKPQKLDWERRFLYMDSKGQWKGRYRRTEILDQIKSGTITFTTPLWDDVRAAGAAGSWVPAWQALDFPAEPNRHLLPLDPADDLAQYFGQGTDKKVQNAPNKRSQATV